MKRRIRALSVVVVAVLPAAALAQDPGAPPAKPPEEKPKTALESAVADLESDEMVITTDRPYDVPLEFAASRTSITPQEVREAGVASIGELLRRTPSFHMGEETGGSDSKPNFGVRGLAPGRSSNIAMLVDGISLNLAPYGFQGGSLFPFTLERIYAVDIYRGGYSTRYGPNNVAGVINFLTRPIPEAPMFDERIRVGSDDYLSAYTAFGGTYGDFGVLFEDVHKWGDTWRENGEFHIDNQGLKTAWRVNDHLRILLQYDHFDDDSENSGGMSDESYESGDLERSRTPYDDFSGWQDRGNVRVIWEPTDDEKYELLTYAFEGYRYFRLGAPVQYDRTPPVTYSSQRNFARVWAAQLTRTAPIRGLGVENSLTLGLKYQDEKVYDDRIRWNGPVVGNHPGEDVQTVDKKYDIHVSTFFAEHEIRPLKGLTVTPAFRWESADYTGIERLTGIQAKQQFTEALPAVSVSYLVIPEVSVFGNLQSTYKPPSGTQLDLTGKDQDIHSERSSTREIGARADAWGGALSGEITHFILNFNDRIQADPQQDDVLNNIGRQRNEGTEIYVHSDLGKVTEELEGFGAYFGYTHLKVKLLTGDLEGNLGPGAPDDKYNWGVDWHHRSGFRAGIDGLWVDKCFSDAENTTDPSPDGIRGINPSYSLWSARAGYGMPVLEGRGKIDAEVGVTNLFGEDYFDRNANKGIVPGAPRQYYLSLAFTMDF